MRKKFRHSIINDANLINADELIIIKYLKK